MTLPSDIETIKETPKKSVLHLIIKITALLLGIGLIVWFVSNSNVADIVLQLKRINYNFIFPFSVTFLAYFLVSIAWSQCFNNRPDNITVFHLFVVRLVGESLAQINPTNVIAGETLKAYLLKKKGVPYKEGIVSLTISRFLIFLSGVTLIIIGIYLFFDNLKFNGNQYSIIVVFSLLFSFLILLIYLLKNEKGIFYFPILFLTFLKKRFTRTDVFFRIITNLKEIDGELLNFYKTKKIKFITVYLLSLLHWIMGAVEFYLILYFLNIDVSFLSCIAIEVGVMVFKALGAFVPGQVGVEEYANKLMLESVHVSGSEVWITASILRRARQLLWIGFGFLAFFLLIRNTKELKNGSVIYNS